MQADDLAEAVASASKKGELAAEVSVRSVADKKLLPYVTYMCLKHAFNALTNEGLYKEHTNWQKRVIYELEGMERLMVFGCLRNYFAAVLESWSRRH